MFIVQRNLSHGSTAQSWQSQSKMSDTYFVEWLQLNQNLCLEAPQGADVWAKFRTKIIPFNWA